MTIKKGLNRDYSILRIVQVGFIILGLILMFGCMASEKDLIQQLQMDPNNTELLDNLAGLYYRKQQYEKAYEQYEKIEKQGNMTKEQKYFMSISGSRISEYSEKSWKELYSFRNTGVVKYKSSRQKRGANLYIPEHWIEVLSESAYPQKVIDNLDFSYDYSVIKSYKIKQGKFSRLQPGKGIIYCGPGFYIHYDIRSVRSIQDTFDGGVYYSYKGADKEMAPYLAKFKNMEESGEISNIEYFFIVPDVSSSGKKKERRMISSDTSYRLDSRNVNIAYITYKSSDDVRYADVIAINVDGLGRMEMSTCYEDEYSKKFRAEFEYFLKRAKFF